ncbi:hypothetical protein TH9_12135 [Thalassospira xiamenensis]|uniref:hypothetical protein n=1 Tax=Thalassospira xiamenensis TaxID=220697 RepID=UPI000DEDD065|nr:hypothetical protein [Thalassospira xiamenensis]RCK32478.1 hypothetical protein TH9_12135 [Thalassospira xiamenensis]
MIPALLALAPSIIGLFTKGGSTAEKVMNTAVDIGKAITGKENPDDIAEALKADPDKLVAYQAQMNDAAIAIYQAENERLEIEGGRVDGETLAALPPEAAAEVAIQRMTTRPWVVRQLTRAIVWPLMAISGVDIVLAVLNTLIAGIWAVVGSTASPIQFDLVAGKFFADPDSIYVQMYLQTVEYGAYIVITYMTLREAGKAGGPKQAAANAFSGLLGGVKSAAKAFRK